MSWARMAIEGLQRGETVQVRPRGNSMVGKIESGELVTIAPVEPEEIHVGDIVLTKVKGNVYLHLVKAIDAGRYLIGNNRGFTNGWTRTVFGKVIKIEK